MTPEHALYLKVCEDPDDRLPRLALLDWWQEHPACGVSWAECEAARAEELDPVKRPVSGRRPVPGRWVPRPPAAPGFFHPRTALIDEWVTTATALRRFGGEVLTCHPVRTVRLTDARITIRLRRVRLGRAELDPPPDLFEVARGGVYRRFVKPPVRVEVSLRWVAELTADAVYDDRPLYPHGETRTERHGAPRTGSEFLPFVEIPQTLAGDPIDALRFREKLVGELVRGDPASAVGSWIDEQWARVAPVGAARRLGFTPAEVQAAAGALRAFGMTARELMAAMATLVGRATGGFADAVAPAFSLPSQLPGEPPETPPPDPS
jgi:hypothetical protein